MRQPTERRKAELDRLVGRTVDLALVSDPTFVYYRGEVIETGLTNRDDEIVLLRMKSGHHQPIYLDDIAHVALTDLADMPT